MKSMRSMTRGRTPLRTVDTAALRDAVTTVRAYFAGTASETAARSALKTLDAYIRERERALQRATAR